MTPRAVVVGGILFEGRVPFVILFSVLFVELYLSSTCNIFINLPASFNCSGFVFFGANSDILYYYGTQAGALGPKLDTQNTKPAKALLYEWFTKLKKGMLPDRSPLNQLTRLDFVFKPNNKSKKVTPINLTFLETAGGNHSDISRGGN